jgi:hypothetical protein
MAVRAWQFVPLAGFDPSGARTLAYARHYKHLAPLERKLIPLLHFKGRIHLIRFLSSSRDV